MTEEQLGEWFIGIENIFETIRKRLVKLENYMEMEDRITCSEVLIRLTKLERNFKYLPPKCNKCDGLGKTWK